METLFAPVEVFYSYAEADAPLLERVWEYNEGQNLIYCDV